jgi:uncharacterized protein
LLKATHFRTDSEGKLTELHYIRTKDDAEIDFCIADHSGPSPALTHLVECKLTDTKPHCALRRFAEELKPAHPNLQAVQVLREAAHDQDLGAEMAGIQIRRASQWLRELAA